MTEMTLALCLPTVSRIKHLFASCQESDCCLKDFIFFMTNTWHTLLLHVGPHQLWKLVFLETRCYAKTKINTNLYIDLLFNLEKSVQLAFFLIFALMSLKMILNCKHRPKDLFWGQSAFSFRAVDIYWEKQNQYMCNDSLDNCVSSCRKPSQQLLLRTCDKFSNPDSYTCLFPEDVTPAAFSSISALFLTGWSAILSLCVMRDRFNI